MVLSLQAPLRTLGKRVLKKTFSRFRAMQIWKMQDFLNREIFLDRKSADGKFG